MADKPQEPVIPKFTGFKVPNILGDMSSDAMSELAKGFIPKIAEPLNPILATSEILAARSTELAYDMPEILIDPSPGRTADAAEETAEYMSQLLLAMQRSVELNEQSRKDSERVERFTRRISWASLWIAIGSTAIALGSLVVALVALTSNP